MSDVWHEGKDIYVSLKNTRSERAQNTEYGDMDLASGYPQNQIWTTADGRRIAIPNLADQHLLNIIAYLRRRSEDYRKMVIAKIAKGVTEVTIISRLFDIPDHIEEEYEAYLKKAEAKAKIWFRMPSEELLRKVVPIYSKLLQECYSRKLLIEVDKTKLDKPVKPKPKPRPKSKESGPPPTDDQIIDSFLSSARDFDGIEVHQDDWEWAEKAVKKYPHQLSLGSARGPDGAWKRLYYTDNGDET